MSETWATTGLVSDSQAMRSPQARGSSMLNLGRRGFIALIGDLATWPLVARAQEARKLPTIGVLGGANASAWRPWTAAFVERLRELGWIEGRTIAIEYRWAEGRDDRKAEIAAEFVRLKADVIVTDGGSTLAAKNVTSVIPIVFALASDPLGRGLVTSLARPGGNVTGLSLLAPDLAGKRLEVMREILAIPQPSWRWVRFMQRPARSASKSRHSKFSERRISLRGAQGPSGRTLRRG
jgi:hypothetical protein